MAMDPVTLETALYTAAFDELQAQFLDGVPDEYKPAITTQHEQLAHVIAKVAGEIVTHLRTYLEATTSVSTVVATTGTAAAQSGTGTGTGILAPGSVL